MTQNNYLELGDKVLLALRKKNTFSAVGLGHERIPFLSTQHNACEKKKKYMKCHAIDR